MSTQSKAANPQRVLVTGSTGAIGQPVCEHLLARGHYVRGFARRATPSLSLDWSEGWPIGLQPVTVTGCNTGIIPIHIHIPM